MATLGERVQQLRKAIGLTQNKLARKIEISHAQMARYEIKGVQPPADGLKKLADVFDTSIDFLVSGNIDDKAAQSLGFLFKSGVESQFIIKFFIVIGLYLGTVTK